MIKVAPGAAGGREREGGLAAAVGDAGGPRHMCRACVVCKWQPRRQAQAGARQYSMSRMPRSSAGGWVDRTGQVRMGSATSGGMWGICRWMQVPAAKRGSVVVAGPPPVTLTPWNATTLGCRRRRSMAASCGRRPGAGEGSSGAVKAGHGVRRGDGETPPCKCIARPCPPPSPHPASAPAQTAAWCAAAPATPPPWRRTGCGHAAAVCSCGAVGRQKEGGVGKRGGVFAAARGREGMLSGQAAAGRRVHPCRRQLAPAQRSLTRGQTRPTPG